MVIFQLLHLSVSAPIGENAFGAPRRARQTPNQNKFSAENSQSVSGGYSQSCDCIVPLQVIGKALSRTESDLQVVAAGIGVHIQHLACKVEAEGLFALHGLGVNLPHRHAA